MFGLLVKKYTELKSQAPEDATACNTILNSLETQWSNADQDIFIAAVLLNPIHKAAPFVKSAKFMSAAIYSLFSRLWTHFYGVSIPAEFFQELKHYFEESGQYKDLKLWIPALRNQAALEVSEKWFVSEYHLIIIWRQGHPVDPIECFNGLRIPGQP